MKSEDPLFVAMGGGTRTNMGLETGFQYKFKQGRVGENNLLFALLLYSLDSFYL